METINKREAWNKGKLVGQKPPLKPKDIWAIRIYLQNAHAVRDLAMFNLAIDSKPRGCDLVSLRVRDITHGNQVLSRAMVIQRKTQRPVQFELTEPTRAAVSAWLEKSHLRSDQFLFPSRVAGSPTSRHANMRGSCITGPNLPGWIHRPTGRIPCGEPRQP
jgi:integrase